MRPAEFQSEAIHEAGEALLAAGRTITGFALRKLVGGGNPTRLKQVWDEYTASKQTTEAVPVVELPVEVAEEVAAVTQSLTERISQLATEMNSKAVKAAERRVAEVVRAAGEQRESAERELVDAMQTVDDTEAALDQERAERAALEQRLLESQQRGQAQAVELAQLNERIAALEKSARAAKEAHARDLAGAEAEALALRTELDATRDGFATARATAEQAERRAEDLRKELDRAHASADAQSAELEKVRAHGYSLTDRVNELQGQLMQATAEAKREAENRQRAEEVANDFRAAAADAKSKADAAEETHRLQREQAAAEALRVAERLAEVQEEREQARKDAAQAREEVARLAGRVEALGEQNTALLASLKAAGDPTPAEGPPSKSARSKK